MNMRNEITEKSVFTFYYIKYHLVMLIIYFLLNLRDINRKLFGIMCPTPFRSLLLESVNEPSCKMDRTVLDQE